MYQHQNTRDFRDKQNYFYKFAVKLNRKKEKGENHMEKQFQKIRKNLTLRASNLIFLDHHIGSLPQISQKFSFVLIRFYYFSYFLVYSH